MRFVILLGLTCLSLTSAFADQPPAKLIQQVTGSCVMFSEHQRGYPTRAHFQIAWLLNNDFKLVAVTKIEDPDTCVYTFAKQ